MRKNIKCKPVVEIINYNCWVYSDLDTTKKQITAYWRSTNVTTIHLVRNADDWIKTQIKKINWFDEYQIYNANNNMILVGVRETIGEEKARVRRLHTSKIIKR